MVDLDAALARHFPEHPGFLPGQREALTAVVEGRDVVAVLPTGGGKTLVYQLAGALLDGTTVVATPLLALMQDQVRRLTEDGDGRRVAAISGAVRGEARERLLADLRDGALDFLFATRSNSRATTSARRCGAAPSTCSASTRRTASRSGGSTFARPTASWPARPPPWGARRSSP